MLVNPGSGLTSTDMTLNGWWGSPESIYSLPIALIVAELSTAFPEDGGYVEWVQEACGKVVGSHHAYWVWVIYVVDAAI